MAQAPYFPFSLPASTVLGRASSGTGAPESIPFGQLSTLLALNATSTTSNTIGTGSKTFITQANLPVSIGQLVIVSNTATPSNFMFGQVTAYSALSGSITINVSLTGGSGTFASWTIASSGPQGATGTTGATGTVVPWAVATGSADAIAAAYSPVNPSLTDGLTLSFRASAANATTTPTFAPDGLTAHTITKEGGTALAIGDIPAALAECTVTYNLANTRWELKNFGTDTEGSWTPVLQGAGGGPLTYTTQVGRYIRKGNLVWVSCTIIIAGGVGITGTVAISGLPFPVSNITNNGSALAVSNWNFTLSANFTDVTANALLNTSTIQLNQCGSAQVVGSVPAGSIGTGTQFIVSGTYRTN